MRPPGEKAKYHNLDGLRGLAALVVMFWHFGVGFLPVLVGFTMATRHVTAYRMVSDTPLFLPFAGTFAVYIFFVLSGFVLSLAFFHKQDGRVLTASAARRYFRLMIPAGASVLFAYFMMRLIGNGAHVAAAQTTGSYWLSAFWDFQPHFFTAVYQGVYGVFFTNFNSYNTNLWTMQNELYGSFMVFLFLGLFGKLNRRWVLYLGFGLIVIKTPYLAFLLGMAICDIWTTRPDLKQLISKPIAHVLLVVGLILGSWHVGWLNSYNPLYGRFTLPLFNQSEMQVFVLIIAAACIILAVLSLGWLSRFFELRPLQYLGKISFSLYLIHWIVLYGFSCDIFNRLISHHVGYIPSFLITFAISVPLIFAISHVFTKYIDARSIGWSKAIGTWLLGSRRPAEQPAGELAPIPIPSVATSSVAD